MVGIFSSNISSGWCWLQQALKPSLPLSSSSQVAQRGVGLGEGSVDVLVIVPEKSDNKILIRSVFAFRGFAVVRRGRFPTFFYDEGTRLKHQQQPLLEKKVVLRRKLFFRRLIRLK